MQVVQIITYVSVIVAFVAMIAKAMRYALAPAHFRWELYPVPHEKGRAEYGGSYLEELDWWSKPRHSDFLNEMKEMAEEILLLKGVFKNNRKVWTFSLPFHFGLYLCIGWLVMLLLGAILQASGVSVSASAGGFGIIIHYITAVLAYSGLVLSGIGGLGLLIWRLTDSNQRVYNSPAEYFNLIAFIAVVAVSLISHLSVDPGFNYLRSYVQSLVTFNPAVLPDGWFTLEVVLVSLMILYIPLTRMSHFVAKYFLYHAVRWNDQPNERGSQIEKSLIKLLQQKVGWSAPHIQSGKPWSDVVKEINNE